MCVEPEQSYVDIAEANYQALLYSLKQTVDLERVAARVFNEAFTPAQDHG